MVVAEPKTQILAQNDFDSANPIQHGSEYKECLIELDQCLLDAHNNETITNLFARIPGSFANLAEPRNVRDFFVACSYPETHESFKPTLKELEVLEKLLFRFVVLFDTVGSTIGSKYIVLMCADFILACGWVYLCLKQRIHQYGNNASTEIDRRTLATVGGALLIVDKTTREAGHSIVAYPTVDFDTIFEGELPYNPPIENKIRYCITGLDTLLDEPPEPPDLSATRGWDVKASPHCGLDDGPLPYYRHHSHYRGTDRLTGGESDEDVSESPRLEPAVPDGFVPSCCPTTEDHAVHVGRFRGMLNLISGADEAAREGGLEPDAEDEGPDAEGGGPDAEDKSE